jgi:hypothetical protein
MKVSLNIDYCSGNYAYNCDCVAFDTIKDALDYFWRDAKNALVDNMRDITGYLYIGTMKDCTDLFPDYIITVGKYGGIICTKKLG